MFHMQLSGFEPEPKTRKWNTIAPTETLKTNNEDTIIINNKAFFFNYAIVPTFYVYSLQ